MPWGFALIAAGALFVSRLAIERQDYSIAPIPPSTANSAPVT
jgi:hypothetical protein